MTSVRDNELLDVLVSMGAGSEPHNSNEDLLAHLCGTRDLLRSWGAPNSLIHAGLFHSVYGTEYFTAKTMPAPSRAQVLAELGSRGETLVWLWCFGRRTTLEPQLERGRIALIQDRRDDEWIRITEQQYDDLVTLWIADTLEQLERMPEREIPNVRRLMHYRERALPAACAALEDVFERIDQPN